MGERRDILRLRRKRYEDSPALQAVVDALTRQVGVLTAQLASLKNKLDARDKFVAFYATDDSHPINTTAQSAIVFSRVLTNFGDAFDRQTGYFTAPMSGLYQFHCNFMSADIPAYVHAAIYVDKTLVGLGISDARHNFYDNAGLEAVVHVRKGQKVYLKNIDDRDNSYYGGKYTTFSGFLLKAD